MARGTCATCAAWDGAHCRKRAPQAIPSTELHQATMTVWPETKAGDWCLDHVSKPPTAAHLVQQPRKGD